MRPGGRTFFPVSTVAASPASALARRLVIFDLDGTLTYHDTFVPYVLGFCLRRPWLLLRFIATLPTVIAFALRLVDHGQVKAAVMRYVLGGRTRAELQSWTDRFVSGLLARGMRPEALQVLESHRLAGDALVLLSASPDLYVPAIGERLGFGEVICTGTRWNSECLEGSLTTPNRRGEEKARCLLALRQGYPGLRTVAYANGPSDLAHLKLADECLLVNAPPWTRRKAEASGISCGDWR